MTGMPDTDEGLVRVPIDSILLDGNGITAMMNEGSPTDFRKTY
jgi:hypothetical protein